MDLVLGRYSPHRRFALVDDERVAQIEKDTKAEDPTGVLGDTSVAEIETEEVDVLRRQLLKVVGAVSAACTAASC